MPGSEEDGDLDAASPIRDGRSEEETVGLQRKRWSRPVKVVRCDRVERATRISLHMVVSRVLSNVCPDSYLY
jgi:hypothetical protein